MEFEVLYYKRTSKVHKSKGVSKVDGILTVLEHPKHTLQLRDAAAESEGDENGNDSSDSGSDDSDGSNNDKKKKKKNWKKPAKSKTKKKKKPSGLVFAGVNAEIAKRAATLQEDDVLALGAYEVQILARCSHPNGSFATASKSVSSRGATAIADGTLKKQPHKLGAVPVRGLVRKVVPLLSKRRGPISVKRNPPVQPLTVAVAAAAVVHSSTTSSSSSTVDDVPTPTGPLRPQVLPLHQQQRHRRPLQAKSILTSSSDKNSVTSNKGGIVGIKTATGLVKKRPAVAATGTSQPSKSLKRSPATATTGTSTVLPHMNLPAAIRQVLRPHQVTGVDFLHQALTCANGGAILADEMGLGKTLMTIAILCALHRQHRDKQFVVVCPSSLVSNWAKEFDKWIGRASQPKRVVIKKGGEEGLQQIRAYFSSMKHQLMNQTGQVLIISYDLFRMHAAQFQDLNSTVGLLVVDEGHRLKNTAGSLTLTALESLQSDARLCITATPIQNNLSEFYNLVNFVCPGLLGDLNTFRRDYERPIAASNNKNASSEQRSRGAAQSRALEETTKTFMLRRLQKDILKSMLPPRTEALLFCRPSAEQSKLYRSITSGSKSTGSFSDALTTLTTLRKVCSHPFLYKLDDGGPGGVGDPKAVLQSGKLAVLDSLLQSIRATAPNDKVVIVSNFTSALSIVESLVLDQRNYSHLRLDGTTDLQNRQPLVDSFNRSTPDKSFCLLLSSKAGGCGLNLIGANRLVMLDPDWNPANDVQAMARIYREGQTKPCTIYRLFTSGTVEEVIYQRQSQKGNLATLTVDGRSGQNTTGRFTKEEISDCFTLKDCDCDTKRKLGSQWAVYDGSESLSLQGCVDEPLINVAESLSETLAFVHIVDDDELAPLSVVDKEIDSASDNESAASIAKGDTMKALYDSDSNDEFEF